jgi:DNA-binding transcriptional regulator PaaX
MRLYYPIFISHSILLIDKDKDMPIEINGKTYYRTAEVCAKAGISRATLFRWLKAGVLKKTYRDRRGWRMFTESDLDIMRAEADTIRVEDNPKKSEAL